MERKGFCSGCKKGANCRMRSKNRNSPQRIYPDSPKRNAGNLRRLGIMRLKRLIFGSSNPGKLQEWKKLLKGIEVISISDLGNFPEPKETGSTFRQNARIKASHYSRLTGEYVFSEDGGYEVDALGGLPGVN